MYYQGAVTRKIEAYEPLRDLLLAEGWLVDEEIHVVTAGLRGTMPKRNDREFQNIGIAEPKQRAALQQALSINAAHHLAIIITKQRKLRGQARHSKRGVG